MRAFVEAVRRADAWILLISLAQMHDDLEAVKRAAHRVLNKVDCMLNAATYTLEMDALDDNLGQTIKHVDEKLREARGLIHKHAAMVFDAHEFLR